MLVQAYLGAERFVAQLARERPLAVVRPPGVHLQAMRRGEHFVTLDARVHVSEDWAPHQHVMVSHVTSGVWRRRGGQRLIGAGRKLLPQLHHVLGRRVRHHNAARSLLLSRRVERIGRRRTHACNMMTRVRHF